MNLENDFFWNSTDFINILNLIIKENQKETKIIQLKLLLNQLRGIKEEQFGFDIITGSYYSFSHPSLTLDLLNEIFTILIKIYEIDENLEDLISLIIVELAAFNFNYFIINIIPELLKNSNTHHLFISISTIILDPTTGFLRNAPLSKYNNEWPENTFKFDFFNKDSFDLKTIFGKSLTEYRLIIKNFIKTFIKYPFESIKKTKLPTIFVPSFMLSVQTIIVPPMFRKYNLSCGFPGRVEILFALSAFQKQNKYEKCKGYTKQKYLSVTDVWAKFFENLTGYLALEIKRPMEFSQAIDNTRDILIRLLKLSFFIGELILDKNEIGDFITSYIFGNNPVMVPFMIVWSQALIILYKDLATIII